MPILRTYGDSAVFGQGAYDAGHALGTSARLAQQRQIDANFIADRLAAREEITRIRTLENYKNARQSGSGGSGGGGRSRGSDIQSVVDDFARDHDDEKTIDAVANAKRLARENEAAGVLGALDDLYKDKDKDFKYFYMKDQIVNSKSVPDRMLQELGIGAKDKSEGDPEEEIQSEAVDAYKPKTDRERQYRNALNQGRPSDIAAILDEKESTNKFGADESQPFTLDALAARSQLEGFISTTSDRELLREYRDELKAAGASDDALRAFDERDAELQEIETQVKAPQAFEQIVSSFGPQLQAMQDKEGRPANMSERRKLLGGIIKTTAKSYGLTVDQIGQYIRDNDENRRMAEMLVQKAQNAIAEMAPPPGTPTGTEDQYGPQGAPLPAGSVPQDRTRRPDRALRQ